MTWGRALAAALVSAMALPVAAEGPPPAPRDRAQLMTQARHYMKKGLPLAAVPYLEEALAQQGADGDSRLLLQAARAYRELDRLEDAFEVLGRGHELPKVRAAAERLARRYGPVRFVARDAGHDVGRLALRAVDLVAVEKWEVYRNVRKRLVDEVVLPMRVYLPYGSFVVNGVELSHRRGDDPEVAVPMPRVLVVTEGPPETEAALVEAVAERLGGEYRVHAAARLHAARGQAADLSAWAPALVVALGPGALQWALWSFRNVPVVFAKVPLAQRRELTRRQRMVTGLADEASWPVAAAAVRRLLPARRRAGFVVHLERGRKEFGVAATALRAVGFEPRVVYVRDAAEVPAALERLAAESDLLWLLPDDALWTAANRRTFTELGMARRLPTIADSEALVVSGALAAVRPPEADLAAGLSELAARIVLGGEEPAGVAVAPPARFSCAINAGVAAGIGLRTPAAALEEASRVVGAH